MPLDPGEHNVRELRDEIGDIDDADELESILEAEQEGKGRKTAIEALQGRLNAVTGEAEGEDGAEAEEADDAAEDTAEEAAEAEDTEAEGEDEAEAGEPDDAAEEDTGDDSGGSSRSSPTVRL